MTAPARIEGGALSYAVVASEQIKPPDSPA
jgi:hypothetical protein